MKKYRSPTRTVQRGLIRSLISNGLSSDQAKQLLKDYAKQFLYNSQTV